jgi:hypothetical protein
MNEVDLEKLDGITNGTAAANKAVVLDGSKNIATIGTIGSGAITSTGASTFGSISNASTVAASKISGSFTGSFVGDGSSLTGVAQDIELLNAYGAATLHQTQDKFLVSDNGTEKSITFSNLQDSVFADITGDVLIAAGGAATIQATSVEGSMLNDNVISGQGALGSAAVAQADLFMMDDGPGTLKKVTFSNLEDSMFNNVSGDIAIAAGGAATIQANSVALSTDTTGNYVGTITGGTGITSTAATSGEGTTHSLSVDAAQTQITSVGALDAGSITSNFGSIVNGASAITTTGTVSAGTLSVSGNATVDGNLDVNGTVTTIQSANLLVKDRFILMNSGSAAGDGGIIVQTESTASGSAFVYDDNITRWGFQQGTKLAQDAATSTPDAYASAVVTSDDANYRKNGNIRVDSGEIYIYIE